MFDDLLAHYQEDVVGSFVEYRDRRADGVAGRSRDGDANANELFVALGAPVTPGEQRGDASLVVVPPQAPVAAIEHYARDLADSLRTATPMHLTVLILAFDGGTVARMPTTSASLEGIACVHARSTIAVG